ncbi:MAG: lipopolysaccharide biosynthesis protein RfbH [Desulfobacteraceae bacterium]|nr:lipopolysaccharide biosynthesis protein RfbH [Desulfobacteraceae bacterium]
MGWRLSLKDIEGLRKEILEKVKEYYSLTHDCTGELFRPGTSKVNYAGRVFDEKEMVNLVESALEFWLTYGSYSKQFEELFRNFLGAGHSFLVNSGSSANLLAFMALTSPYLEDRQIKRGDEVITVAAAFPTTISPILQYGAVPVFLDVDIETLNVKVESFELALSPKTKAVMLAHTLGNPFDLEAVKKFCKTNELWLIEDNCDALGSRYIAETYWSGEKEIEGQNNEIKEYQFTGTFGDIGTSSFYPAHHMTMGEGGATYTNDSLLKKIMLSLRDWGRDCWCDSGRDNTCGCRFSKKHGQLPFGYDHKFVYSHFGYNLKCTDLQAAIGCAQIEKLPGFIEKRKENFKIFYETLCKYEDIFILPRATHNSDPSWFGFILTLRDTNKFKRNELVEHLESKNIQTRNLFAGNILRHPCFEHLENGKHYRVVGDLENTEKLMNDSFWLGVYPGMTEEKIAYMIQEIEDFIKRSNR